MRGALELLSQGVIIRGRVGEVLFANHAAGEILGVAGSGDLSTSAVGGWDIVDDAGNPVHLPILQVASAGLSWSGMVFRVRRPGRPTLWLSSDARPLTLADGSRGSLSVFTDITAGQAARERAEADAQALTLIAASATDAMWRSDPEGRAEWVSPSVRRILGWDPEQLLGTSMMDLVHPDDQPAARRARAAGRQGSNTGVEARLRRADGSWCPMGLRVGPYRDALGHLEGTFVTARDMTGEREALDRLVASEYRLRVLTELADLLATTPGAAAICRVSAQLMATRVAHGALILLGSGVHDIAPIVVARREQEATTVETDLAGARGAPGGASAVADLLSGGAPRLLVELAADDRDQPWEARLAPSGCTHLLAVTLAGPDQCLGAACLYLTGPPDRQELDVVTSMTSRIALALRAERLREDLAAQEAHYRLIAENSTDVVLRVGADDVIDWVSPSSQPTLGWEPAALVGRTLGDFLDAEADPPADHAGIAAVPGTAGEVLAHLRRPDGRRIWIEYSSVLVPAQDGREAVRVMRLRDVDARVTAQVRQHHSEEIFRTTMVCAPVGMSVSNSQRHFERVNPALCALLGRSEAWLLEHGSRDVTAAADDPIDRAMRAELLSRSVQSVSREHRLVRGDGTLIWVQHAISRLPERLGSDLRFVSQYILADLDPLTELLNRRALLTRIRTVLSHPDRAGAGPAVLYCDLDGLKPINDRLGHAAGDQLLVEVAARLMRTVRREDAVARMGGDEFVVLLTGAQDVRAARAAAEKIRRAVAQPMDIGGVELVVTLSVGIAMASQDRDPDRLLDLADQALYRAKAGAGDGLVVAG